MNQLHGFITDSSGDENIRIIDVRVGEDRFTSIFIDDSTDDALYTPGTPVNLIFKETEVSIGKDITGKLSLRNRIQSTIKEINRGKVISEVILDYNGIPVASVITTRSVDNLELSPGDRVVGLVKANEMTIRLDRATTGASDER